MVIVCYLPWLRVQLKIFQQFCLLLFLLPLFLNIAEYTILSIEIKLTFMQVKKSLINEFLSISPIALYGMSRSEKKFGNHVLTKLSEMNKETFPIHHKADQIQGKKCWSSINEVKKPVRAAFISLPPKHTIQVVKELKNKAVNYIWLQPGAESDEVIAFCHENDMQVIHGLCIMMFLEPVESIHKFHRFFWRIFNKLEN